MQTMKKSMKYMGVLFISLLMMAMMAMPTLAAGASDKTDVKITGFGDKTPTVTLYQIWKGNYEGSQFTWDKATGTTDLYGSGDSENPTAEKINEIAAGLKSNNITPYATVTNGTISGGTYTANVGAGVYIAVITPAAGDDTVYNPILLAASYDGTVLKYQDKAVDISDQYLSAISTAKVKSSTPGVVKKAKATTDTTKTDGDNQTASVGQVVTYTVTPTMPQYPSNAVDKTFYFSDTLSKGLTFDYSSLTVKWNGKDLTANAAGEFKDGNTVIAKAKESGNGFNLYFEYDNLNYLAPTLEYKAVLNKDAVVGTQGNDNTINMYYTNKPSEGSTYKNLDKPPQEGSGYKHKEDKEVVYTYQISFKKTGVGNEADKLPGAVFGIYSDEACTQLVDTVTTNENGYAISTQVGYGKYWVKEIKAPAGYSLNTNKYPVESEWTSVTTKTTGATITTEYTSNIDEATEKTQVGWLKGNVFYDMNNKPSGSDTEVLAAYVKGTTTTTATSTSFTENQAAGSGTFTLSDIPNTKTPSLPSTGSIGTYLFTIAGVALIVFAGYVLMRDKKQKANK